MDTEKGYCSHCDDLACRIKRGRTVEGGNWSGRFSAPDGFGGGGGDGFTCGESSQHFRSLTIIVILLNLQSPSFPEFLLERELWGTIGT
jgi:hypothetical protein